MQHEYILYRNCNLILVLVQGRSTQAQLERWPGDNCWPDMWPIRPVDLPVDLAVFAPNSTSQHSCVFELDEIDLDILGLILLNLNGSVAGECFVPRPSWPDQ